MTGSKAAGINRASHARKVAEELGNEKSQALAESSRWDDLEARARVVATATPMLRKVADRAQSSRLPRLKCLTPFIDPLP